MTDERDLVVLLNEDGTERSTATKLAAHQPPGRLHLAFSVFLFDAQGRVLLQRRADGKALFAHYGDCLKELGQEPKALFTPTPKVPGLDGRKMSKSYGNAINLSDPPDVIREKCKSMFTDPTRIRRSDPGHPDTCNLFAFHRLLSPPELAAKVDRECRAAEIGCVDDKKLLAEQIIAFLEPLQKRRAELTGDPGELLRLLRSGSERARERAHETMTAVRVALGLDYDRLLAARPA